MSVAHLEYRPHWTVADLEHIPEEFRAEIVHGALVMNPAPKMRHQILIYWLTNQLYEQLPEGWACASDIDVVFADDHVRRPDLAVVRREKVDTDPTSPDDIGLVVEVVSPGSELVDRRDKPREYAAAGIPAYWRIETRGVLELVGYELVGDSYVEHEPATETFTMRQPWPITIDVPALSRITPSD